MHRTDLTEKVFQELRRRIVGFQLLPGVRISDKTVAEELSVSRTPVRQALFKLAEKGLVEARHNHGFRVRIFSIDAVRDLYLFREALEKLAVRQTIAAMDQANVVALREHMAAYREVIDSASLYRLSQLDAGFHQLIADLSGSDLLSRTIANLQDQLQVVMRYQHLSPRSFTETREEHGVIVDLIIAGKVRQAVAAMSDHILISMNFVISILQELDGKR